MTTENHLHTTASALKRWAIAQLQDSLAVGVLWTLGLWIIHVPWAPLWAVLAAALQIIPHFGPILSLLGPVLSAALHWRDWQHPLYVLILYAVIVVVDGFLPALHHAPRGASAHVGIDSRPFRPRISNPILGISASATAAGGNLRVQSETDHARVKAIVKQQ